MKTKHLIATAAVAAACYAQGAAAEVLNGDVYGAHQYGAWMGYLVTHGNDVRFRASTGSGNWNIFFDAVPPTCKLLVSMALLLGGDAIQQDLAPADYAAALRVDQDDLLYMNFNVNASMGDTSLLFTAYLSPSFDTLLNQMQSGQQLMMKLSGNDGKPYYMTFPLNGFMPAVLAETQACMVARNSTKPDKPTPKPSQKKQSPPDNTKIL